MIALIVETRTKVHIRIRQLYHTKEFENNNNNNNNNNLYSCPEITQYRLSPFSAKDVLIDFTLSNARLFYSSKGNPLGTERVKTKIPEKHLKTPHSN